MEEGLIRRGLCVALLIVPCLVVGLYRTRSSVLIVDLHGAGMRPHEYRSWARWPRTPTVVYPAGYERVWNAGTGTYPPASSIGYDHVREIERIVEGAPRVVVSGLSNGAAMAQRYALERTVDAVICASHNVVVDPPGSTRPTPFMAFTHDPAFPPSDPYVASFENVTIATWRVANRVGVAPYRVRVRDMSIHIWDGDAPIVWVQGNFGHAFHVTHYLYLQDVQDVLRTYDGGRLVERFGHWILA